MGGLLVDFGDKTSEFRRKCRAASNRTSSNQILVAHSKPLDSVALMLTAYAVDLSASAKVNRFNAALTREHLHLAGAAC